METEEDNKLAFLDTAVLREPDGRLTTSVYWKPTHTDQYLAYDSPHPQSVKCGIVRCLYERAKRFVAKPSVISEEKKHLSSVLVSNGYPFSLLQILTKTGNRTTVLNPPTSSKLLRFYLMSKVCPHSFVAAYNNKACALFSSWKNVGEKIFGSRKEKVMCTHIHHCSRCLDSAWIILYRGTCLVCKSFPSSDGNF